MSTRPSQDEPPAPLTAYQPTPRRSGGRQRQSILEAILKSFIRSLASSLGRIIVKTLTRRGR
ncbi:MAG TPA: hypothetical protein VFY92_12655 [Hyphomicrobiaceae bacterium]|nr:hypothetical protein [Hyphomicrobiaceae bacterium]